VLLCNLFFIAARVLKKDSYRFL